MKLNRRKTLLGLGAAAGGGGIVFGSGAFTQVQADRDVTIGIDSDSEALLALRANDDVTSVYEDDSTGELVIDTDELSSDDSGFNVGATAQIGATDDEEFGDVVSEDDFAFKLRNNFDNAEQSKLDVEIDLEDLGQDVRESDANVEFVASLREGDPGEGADGDPEVSETVLGGTREVFADVTPGDEIHVAIRIETGSTSAPEDLEGSVTFRAGSDLSDDFPTQRQGVTEVDTVSGLVDAVDEANEGDEIRITGDLDDEEEWEDTGTVDVTTSGITITGATGTEELDVPDSDSFTGSGDRGVIRTAGDDILDGIASDVTIKDLEMTYGNSESSTGTPCIAAAGPRTTIENVTVNRIKDETDNNFTQAINIVAEAAGTTIRNSVINGDGDEPQGAIGNGITVQVEDVTIEDNEFNIVPAGDGDVDEVGLLGQLFVLPDTEVTGNQFNNGDDEGQFVVGADDPEGILRDNDFDPDAEVDGDNVVVDG